MSTVHYHLDGYIAHPGESCRGCEAEQLTGSSDIDLRGNIQLTIDEDFEPEGEVFATNATVHIERMDKNLWWFIIDQAEGPSLVGHFRSKVAIKVTWEWEDQ